jgi:hypothetical protein
MDVAPARQGREKQRYNEHGARLVILNLPFCNNNVVIAVFFSSGSGMHRCSPGSEEKIFSRLHNAWSESFPPGPQRKGMFNDLLYKGCVKVDIPKRVISAV